MLGIKVKDKRLKGKVSVLPVEAYREGGGIAPLIRNFSSRWR